jgi:hypothetical protein
MSDDLTFRDDFYAADDFECIIWAVTSFHTGVLLCPARMKAITPFLFDSAGG